MTLRKNIAKYFGYPLQDWIKHTNIIKTLSFLRESQFWDEEKLEDYRLMKLKNLISFAHKNVPYYEKLFNSKKVQAADIKRIEDLNKIPLLTKEIVRRENYNLIARGYSMRHIKRGKTGGTTGAPILVLKDIQNRSFTWASYYRWYEWMGINYYDSEATFWGSRTVLNLSLNRKIIETIKDFLQNNIKINSFRMNELQMSEIYKRVKDFNPVILKGYLSALLIFANFIDTYSLEKISPRAVSSTSEMLLPNNRRYLEEVFNAPVYDQYGCGEISAISYECSKHNGLHLNQEHIICEILGKQNEPLINKTGRVIGTDLDNYVMPFIRYETGDLATMSSVKCTCGINQPLMDSIDGRTIDTLVLKDGSSVHGVFITDILFEMGIFADKINRFQLYQNESGSVLFKYESTGEIGLSVIKELEKNLSKFFNNVEIRKEKELSIDASGKFRYIINEINRH